MVPNERAEHREPIVREVCIKSGSYCPICKGRSLSDCWHASSEFRPSATSTKEDTPFNLGWSAGYEACKRANSPSISQKDWLEGLRDSELNFNRQFGISVAAAWVYRDLEELFATPQERSTAIAQAGAGNQGVGNG